MNFKGAAADILKGEEVSTGEGLWVLVSAAQAVLDLTMRSTEEEVENAYHWFKVQTAARLTDTVPQEFQGNGRLILEAGTLAIDETGKVYDPALALALRLLGREGLESALAEINAGIEDEGRQFVLYEHSCSDPGCEEEGKLVCRTKASAAEPQEGIKVLVIGRGGIPDGLLDLLPPCLADQIRADRAATADSPAEPENDPSSTS